MLVVTHRHNFPYSRRHLFPSLIKAQDGHPSRCIDQRITPGQGRPPPASGGLSRLLSDNKPYKPLANVGKHNVTKLIYDIDRIAQDVGGGIIAILAHMSFTTDLAAAADTDLVV